MATVLIDRLLQTCIRQGASDLHLTKGLSPTLRLHGRLRQLETKVLESDDLVSLMKSITPERSQQELQEVGGCDFGFAFGDGDRFRVSVFKQRGDVAIVMRLIPSRVMTFEELGTPAAITELLTRPRGLVLVTGPTGCGKTTTLATMIHHINETVDQHIITIEDPIEFYHQHRKSIINQRQVGVDVPSFAEALRRVLRMDPDVILVGELRDLETIQSAITAAETGHLVFGTLHTTGAEGTVNRIVDVFPTDQQEQIRTMLSVSIIAVLSQALMPRIPKGMVAAYELMVVTSAIANLIRENKTYRINSAIQTGKKLGMLMLDDSLFDLWSRGLVEEKDVLLKAQRSKELAEKISAHRKAMATEAAKPGAKGAQPSGVAAP